MRVMAGNLLARSEIFFLARVRAETLPALPALPAKPAESVTNNDEECI